MGLNAPLKNWWNFDFELFYSKLEHVENGILYQGTLHSGTPKLAGTHLSIEPIEGWKIGVNRMMQFGGGPRKVSMKDVFKAYFDPAGNDNSGLTGSVDKELGDQWVTITSSLRTNFITPVEWYLETGGEDTREHKNYQFGNVANSFGMFFPQLTRSMTLRFEHTNMHRLWYVHHIYPKAGNSINGSVVGHFVSDRRIFNDGVATQVNSMEVGLNERNNSFWKVKLLSIENKSSSDYQTSSEFQIINNRSYDDKRLETTLTIGKDVFGENYTWLAVNVYW